MKKPRFNKVTIIGVGLIGGSIGMAIRKKRLAREVLGVSRHKSSILRARRLGAIDIIPKNLKEAVSDSDLIIIATPILKIIPYVKKIKKFLKKGSIIIDVGSTKEYIVKEIEKILPSSIYYVGTHPMAGSQLRGVGVANPNLFQDSICVLTKTTMTKKSAFNRIKIFWNILGARTIVLPAPLHDKLISMISHLPHVVVASLVDSIEPRALSFAASGFKDTTRIAGSDPALWRDICLTNRKYIVSAIDKFTVSLEKLKKSIDHKEGNLLFSIFKKVQEKRSKVK